MSSGGQRQSRPPARRAGRRHVTLDAGELAAIIASSSDSIVGWTLEGIITSWNPGAEQLYGYTADEVVGESYALLLPPDQRNALRTVVDRIRQGERIEPFETVRLRK